MQSTWHTSNSVADLIVETICPFTSPKNPVAIRVGALDAICTVAQDWPKLYLRADVVNAFETVFQEQESSLEEVLLSGLEAFYRLEDSLKGAEEVPELGTGVASGTERHGRTYVATDRDGASTSLAQRFLPQILRLALSSLQEKAFIAAKLVVSINKHSLVLPKLSAPALVALETCPNQSIANLAFSLTQYISASFDLSEVDHAEGGIILIQCQIGSRVFCKVVSVCVDVVVGFENTEMELKHIQVRWARS